MSIDFLLGLVFLIFAILLLFACFAAVRDDEESLSFFLGVMPSVAFTVSVLAFIDYGAKQDVELDTKWEPVIHYIHSPETNTFDTVYIYKYENRIDNERV